MDSKNLTEKQRMFCEEYLIDLNACQAAIRAGYSARSAKEVGCENLKKPAVAEYLSKLQKERSKKVEIEAEDVLRILKSQIDGDYTNFIGLTPQEIKNLPKELTMLVEGMKNTIVVKSDGSRVVTVDLKFVDRQKALDMINRHIGFYEKDNSQQNANVNNIINLGEGIAPEDEATTQAE